MEINTTRFGLIDIPAECFVTFEHGMPGFPEQHKFALFPFEPESVFYFLQSVTEPDLTFLLTDPYAFFNDYVFELDDTLAEQLGFNEENVPHIYVVATLKDKLEEATVNLMAPIVISWKNQTGVQLILEKSPYSVKQSLFPNGVKAKKAAPADRGGK